MEINNNKIKTLESLTKLSLSDEERDTVSSHFDYLLSSFDKLEGIDTKDVEPLISVTSLKNILREDKSFKTVNREELLANAPEENNGYFQVPKTIE